MNDGLTSNLSSVTSSVTDSTKKLNDAFGTVQKAGAALTGVGAGIIGAGLATVKSTFDTQDALGELSSLGVTDLKAVESAAKSFSDTWAGTTKSDFITAAYDIKSGIASLTDEGVAQFTELAALTGKATKSTTEEMGSLFATGYGIYKSSYEDLSDLEFGEMFSAGISTAVKNYKIRDGKFNLRTWSNGYKQQCTSGRTACNTWTVTDNHERIRGSNEVQVIPESGSISRRKAWSYIYGCKQ